jgi:hypothetical protein
MRLRPVPLSIGLLALCAAIVAFVELRRASFDDSPGSLVRHLPSANAVHFFIDLRTIRAAGLMQTLAGSKAAQETDYQSFVDETHFDYSRDVDSVVGAIQENALSVLLSGRFDWNQLRRYCESKGGQCMNGFCSVESKRPGRFVSFFALAPNVLALTVGDSAWGAHILGDRKAPLPDFAAPRHAAWATWEGRVLRERSVLPDGVKALVGALRDARRVTISLTDRADAFEAVLDAAFDTPAKANEAAAALAEMTDNLRKFLAREKQTPNPRDLSGVLTSGQFQAKEGRVSGRWAIERAFLESLSEGHM